MKVCHVSLRLRCKSFVAQPVICLQMPRQTNADEIAGLKFKLQGRIVLAAKVTITSRFAYTYSFYTTRVPSCVPFLDGCVESFGIVIRRSGDI